MFELTLIQAIVLALGSMGLGIILLVKGGDWTVDAANFIAIRFGIPPMLVGFTVVAAGTSLPELVVSVVANLQGSGGIAIGNVLGSNIANILLVIGATALFATLKAKSRSVLKDLTFMMLATGIMTGLMIYGDIGRLAGFGMVTLLILYITLQYIMNKNGEMDDNDSPDDEQSSYKKPFEPYLFLFMGLIAIAAGAELLVRGATVSADVLGVPDAVIALSIIALGTSLPELSTCIIAGRKGHSDIVIGNIIGSNVFNILMILGITSMVTPILQNSYAQQLVEFDIWFVLGISTLFTLILLFYNKITRPIGMLFLTCYIGYNIYIYLMNLYNL